MPVERFYKPIAFSSGKIFNLEGSEYHHLKNVVRITAGEEVECINGKGELAQVEVDALTKTEGTLRVLSVTTEPRPRFECIIAQAIPRQSRLETVVEKSTELGMTQLWLFPGKRSGRKALSNQHQKRIELLAISAMKQCGRLWLPEIRSLPPLTEWEAPPYAAYYGDIEPDATPFQAAVGKTMPTEGILFFIGPEGGFDNEEIELLKAFAATGVKLHNNILRTDTAPLVALSLIQHWLLA
ncbi:16S rRNA (uracil(1498)-N(3))-methyltransferase [Simkania negevensis]|uniref:Ribosomal RNA small subunit methyltransferase E n=1 Tax=Simkania negevensis TaxID=83561 RepID=A0ABS3ARC8_9BACT|nr:16S rRNA (uracil(1498)-N(3))-methyltransferase [Simkania negevensis]